MSQEAITEIEMEVFSRRIGPYFSWLESKIEGGWEQNENVPKDVLKEIKYLATTMRARFILGVTKEDFPKEVKRALELFELALDAFPNESDEIESRSKHFCKGVSEELGPQFLPAEYREPRPPEPPDPHPVPPKPEPIPEPEPEPSPEPKPVEEVVKVKKPRIEVKQPKVVKVTVEKPKVVKKPKIEIIPEVKKQKVTVKKTPVVEKAEVKQPKVAAKKKSKKSFFLIRWAKDFIYGED